MADSRDLLANSVQHGGQSGFQALDDEPTLKIPDEIRRTSPRSASLNHLGILARGNTHSARLPRAAKHRPVRIRLRIATAAAGCLVCLSRPPELKILDSPQLEKQVENHATGNGSHRRAATENESLAILRHDRSFNRNSAYAVSPGDK